MRETIVRQLANPDVQAIITTGGTGITSRDSTYEAIGGLLQKRLDGFGELFRMLSYEQIGAGRDDEPRLRRPGRPDASSFAAGIGSGGAAGDGAAGRPGARPSGRSRHRDDARGSRLSDDCRRDAPHDVGTSH